MSRMKKIVLSIFLCFTSIIFSLHIQTTSTKAFSSIGFVILTKYKQTVDIGDEFQIIAITSDGKFPTWKSSDSKVATVNTYGKVTAKKSGVATITAKIKNGEASCKVTVNKTKVSISSVKKTIERGEKLKLSVTTSNHSKVTFKSSKKSIATIDENGMITGIKPGETTITVSADGSSTSCLITVKRPSVKLNKSQVSLYRGQTSNLSAVVSSGVSPTWKTNKKGVATVDENGTITAIKNGVAIITATVDGVSKTCQVIVKQPTITLSSTQIELKAGNTSKITAKVSSENTPLWSTSNPNVAKVDATGVVTGLQKGRAYIYATEDGVKMRCIVHVTQ